MPMYSIICKLGHEHEVFAHMHETPMCPTCGMVGSIDWRRQSANAPKVRPDWHGTAAKSLRFAFDSSGGGRKTLAEEGCPKLASALDDDGRVVFKNDRHQRAIYAEMTAAKETIEERDAERLSRERERAQEMAEGSTGETV